MLPESMYRYIWQVSRAGQIHICILTAIIAPLSMVPLELQRRIVDGVLKDGGGGLDMLLLLGGAYIGVVLIQNGAKYLLNITKGRVLEQVARDIRLKMFGLICHRRPAADEWGRIQPVDSGTTVSVLAAESEAVGGFASESFSVPMLQFGTIVWVMGYLIWVQPLIAAFAILVYAVQVFTVPKVQETINRLARLRTRTIRRLGRCAAEDVGQKQADECTAHAGRLIDHAYRMRMQIYRRKFFLTFLGNVLDATGPIAALTVGGWMVIHGQTEISTLVVFISGFQKISDPWDVLITFYRTMSTARVTYGLVADTLADESDSLSGPHRAHARRRRRGHHEEIVGAG
jgi:ABC-type multidrug transport system fused ATPase/permease subunit